MAWGALAQGGSPVEGQLIDSITHNGIPGIKVTVTSIRAVVSYEIVTGYDGRFRFQLVAPGDYTITFQTIGYLPLAPGDPATHIFHVADMAAPIRFQEELTPYGRVSGRVFTGDGKPAPGVQIEMLRPRGAGVSVNTTDGEGRFTIFTLRPGSYVLLARPMLPGSGGDEQRRTTLKPPVGAEGERLTWAATYYPGATDRGGAQTIVVRPGANLTSYDIHLRAAELRRVRGTVTDELGKPAAGADVVLHSTEPLTGPEAKTQTAGDGSFELPDVCPGDWRILVELERGKALWKGSGVVSVARADLDSVNVRIAPPFTVEGYVERDGQRDVSTDHSSVLVALWPADPSRDRQITSTYRQDSALIFEGVYAGRYRIVASGYVQGFYIDAVRLGIADVTGQPVELTPASPPIRIVYRSGAGRAVGLVDDSNTATVVLAPKNDALMAAQFARSASTGQDGRFDISSLRPGDYYIWAFDHAEITAMSDPDFVRALIPFAETVHVEQGQVEVTPNLKVISWPE